MNLLDILALAGAITLLGGTAAFVLFLIVAAHFTRSPDPWAETDVAEINRCCAARHCAGCDEFAPLAPNLHYRPAHSVERTAPELRPALLLMTPTERAKELVRQLRDHKYSPYNQIADWKTRIVLQRHTIARRHGLLLGPLPRRVRLP